MSGRFTGEVLHREEDDDMCGGSPLIYIFLFIFVLLDFVKDVGEITQERRYFILLSFSPLLFQLDIKRIVDFIHVGEIHRRGDTFKHSRSPLYETGILIFVV